MLSAVRIKGFKQKRTQVKRLAKFLHLPVAITLSALYTTSEKSGHLLTFLQLLSSDLRAYTNSPAKGKNKWHLRSCFRNAFRALLNLNFPVEKNNINSHKKMRWYEGNKEGIMQKAAVMHQLNHEQCCAPQHNAEPGVQQVRGTQETEISLVQWSPNTHTAITEVAS